MNAPFRADPTHSSSSSPQLLTQPTALLDYSHPTIQALIDNRGWRHLPTDEQIGHAYNFVRDEIRFGYNRSDDLPASEVLADGIGQCNTKSTLFMALLRGLGIACRFHGFTIDKALQRGVVTGWAYWLAPASIIHSWVEVRLATANDGTERWVNLEGFILDRAYLAALQRRFASQQGSFIGYGVATEDFRNPAVEWRGGDTYIQREGINADLGVFDSPDEFYSRHGVNLSGIRAVVYASFVRHSMNRTVERIRRGIDSGRPIQSAGGGIKSSNRA